MPRTRTLGIRLLVSSGSPVSGEMSCTLSKCASWVGTVHYMSPERISASDYSFAEIGRASCRERV